MNKVGKDGDGVHTSMAKWANAIQEFKGKAGIMVGVLKFKDTERNIVTQLPHGDEEQPGVTLLRTFWILISAALWTSA